MAKRWTYGQKVGLGFAITAALAIVLGVIAVRALHSVVESKDRVIDVNADRLITAQKLHVARESAGAAARGYLLTGEDKFRDTLTASRASFADSLEHLRTSVTTDEERRMLDVVASAAADHQRALDAVIEMRRADPDLPSVSKAFDTQVGPERQRLDAAVVAFVSRETELLEAAERVATAGADASATFVLIVAVCAVVFAGLVALIVTRSLGREIGLAVSHVKSSSAELQAAASQQAAGAKEQATAMNEITTTISELLATSRQIADSAQRVAEIAERTAESGRAGEGTVERTHESIGSIRRQVDLVVSHMLDLGKKSQEIGAVLDIVYELAEQTNILAINATIEAAGASDSGKRFGAVADEIRKLADRVGGATKEIRALIGEVQSAVNTTVMVTETGSKAVDHGSRQFGDVASSFKAIAELVLTTTEAAREIELSTKQQASAVEQVNVAIANVTQAAKETEASSGQTAQTASQLASLSRDLQSLVQREAVA